MWFPLRSTALRAEGSANTAANARAPSSVTAFPRNTNSVMVVFLRNKAASACIYTHSRAHTGRDRVSSIDRRTHTHTCKQANTPVHTHLFVADAGVRQLHHSAPR